MNRHVVDRFQKLLEVNQPIIYIEDFDFVRVDQIIEAVEKAADSMKIAEWNPATGHTNFKTKEKMPDDFALKEFLMEAYAPDTDVKRLKKKGMNPAIYVLREINELIDQPEIKTLLALIAQRHLYEEGYDIYIVLSSAVKKVPVEIEKYVADLDIWPMPGEHLEEEREEYLTQIERLISEHGEANNYNIGEKARKELRQLLTGMRPFDIDRMIDMAMSKNGTLDLEDKDLLESQKKSMVKQSGVLELIETPETIDSIGGLNNLKKYLSRKAKIYRNLSTAIEDYGISIPKGVFIVGMPGCGKSLCAKASSAIFGVPLLKLDMGSLMGKYVGESEANLRKAIRIAEAVSPCILWIDEIEKALSGVANDENDVIRRMYGAFLTWMQDKQSAVYVIATANSADNLPPELKRKGRFDEIFCVNLPDRSERQEIFKVHLKKRKGNRAKWSGISVDSLASKMANLSEGCNGADIESIINESVEEWFLSGGVGNFGDILENHTKGVVNISQSCKDQINKMKAAFNEGAFVDASKE